MKNGYNGQDAFSNLLQVVDTNHARPVGSAVLGSEIVGALNAVDYKWPQNQQLDENKFIVVETETLFTGASHAVATFTKAKRAQSTTDDETWVEGKPAPTLNAFDQGDTRATTVVAFATNQRAEVRDLEDKAVALSAEPGTNQQTYIAFENSYRDGIRIATEDVSQTLSAKMGTGGNNTPMVAIGIQGNVIGRQDHNGPAGKGPLITPEKSGTLAAGGNDQTVFQPTQTTAFQPGTMTRLGGGVWEEIAPTLRAEAKRGDNEPHIATNMAVRRLTPIECERLMGWPDNWTDGQADTHRYKQCGNGVASPVATWIGQQLQQLDKEHHAPPTQTPTT